MTTQIRVTVWGENVHERENPIVAEIYPDGMHQTIADAISEDGDCEVRTATLHDPEHGLTDDVLENTDVLVWWGHAAHGKVADEVVERILARVWGGNGIHRVALIALFETVHALDGHKLLNHLARSRRKGATLGLQPGPSDRAWD